MSTTLVLEIESEIICLVLTLSKLIKFAKVVFFKVLSRKCLRTVISITAPSLHRYVELLSVVGKLES